MWEDDGVAVAVVLYEVSLGEAFFVVDPSYSFLAEEFIHYAEKELTDSDGNLELDLKST